MPPDAKREGTESPVVVLNPTSGTGDHVSEVRDRALTLGYDVRETERAGDGIDLTRDAAGEGASQVVAGGGDGTLNEVVRGVQEADAFEDVTVGILPCGTGNDFATNVGIGDVEEAFDVLEHGERRWIDVGVADDRPFVNSCVGGLTADASADTSTELKGRLGSVAYVLNTLRTLPSFDGIRVSVDGYETDGKEPLWSGDAIAVLVGNGRCFPPGGSRQANMEDGELDVTLVHGTDSIDVVQNATLEGLLGRDTPNTTRKRVPSLEIEVREGDPIAFSLDGEIVEREHLSVHTQPSTLHLAVGEGYDPEPDT